MRGGTVWPCGCVEIGWVCRVVARSCRGGTVWSCHFSGLARLRFCEAFCEFFFFVGMCLGLFCEFCVWMRVWMKEAWPRGQPKL